MVAYSISGAIISSLYDAGMLLNQGHGVDIKCNVMSNEFIPGNLRDVLK